MERLECDRMFVAVMEMGSFSSAALRLGISAGQASKLISALERDLGVQLFKRSTRSLAPTEVGLAYFDKVKVLLDGYDALNDSVKDASGSPSGRVKLSAPVTFGSMQLSSHLIMFAQQYPQIDLDVSFSDRLVNVVDDGFDLALRIGKLTDSSLMARRLCDIRTIVVASPQYLNEKGVPAHWDELPQHDCIIDTNFRDPFHWSFKDSSGNIQQSPIRGRLRFSNAEVCLQAACANLGIAHLPTFVAAKALRESRVVPILSDYETDPLGLYALYPAAKHLARTSRTVIDFLVAAFAGEVAWDTGW
jgi:DNA-binding transcriptional LysR family regulator